MHVLVKMSLQMIQPQLVELVEWSGLHRMHPQHQTLPSHAASSAEQDQTMALKWLVWDWMQPIVREKHPMESISDGNSAVVVTTVVSASGVQYSKTPSQRVRLRCQRWREGAEVPRDRQRLQLP